MKAALILRPVVKLLVLLLISGGVADGDEGQPNTVASALSKAKAADGRFVSWREHIIDDESLGGVAIRGSDGLAVADLDRDGRLDIVSVHESDTGFRAVADGHVRLAFGSEDPAVWQLATLADGAEAGAAEDVAIDDLNGDGYPDIVVACEMAHLIYFQNPGKECRSTSWPRVIPPLTTGRGSFIRVFFADLDADGRPEVVAPNKGDPDPKGQEPPRPISWFEIVGDPLVGANWREHVLARIPWPINSQPVDLDGDGDLDIVAGTLAEKRVLWFENRAGDRSTNFRERRIDVLGTSLAGHRRPVEHRDSERALVHGFQLDFADMSGDGRLDIVLAEDYQSLVWLEQPADRAMPWRLHTIGDYAPDHLAGICLADINDDGRLDVMTGSYSRGPRTRDGDVTEHDPLGRLAWFEQPADRSEPWTRHDISRRKRGMFDKFASQDVDGDGDLDFLATRGNSDQWDGVFWLEQVRTDEPVSVFESARRLDSAEVALPSIPK